MAICNRSRHSCALNGLASGLMVALLAPPPLGQASSPPGDVRTRIEAEAPAAEERLKADIARRQESSASPVQPRLPALPEDQRRRAFDGLDGHVRSPEAEHRAETALAKGKEAMAAEREAMAKRIGQALGLDAPDMKALAGIVSAPLAASWVPVLFASSSMPVSTLRNYAGQLEKVGGVIAFRGMPGGLRTVGSMAKLSAEMLRIDPGCEGPACAMRNVQVIVDPIIFRQHHVAAVPALAMVPGDPTQPYCERDDASPVALHLVYGDAALSGLLDEYARLGGTKEVADAQARLQRR